MPGSDSRPKQQFGLLALFVLVAVLALAFAFLKIMGFRWIIFLAWGAGCLLGLRWRAHDATAVQCLARTTLGGMAGGMASVVALSVSTSLRDDHGPKVNPLDWSVFFVGYGAIFGALVAICALMLATGAVKLVAAIRRRRNPAAASACVEPIVARRLSFWAGFVLVAAIGLLLYFGGTD